MSSASNWWAIDPYPSNSGTATSLTATTSSAEVALAKGGGRYLFTAIGANVYIAFGVTGMSAASTSNFGIAIASGQSIPVTVPDSVTYFRAYPDANATLAWGKCGN